MSFDKDKKTRARKGSAWFPPQLENLTGEPYRGRHRRSGRQALRPCHWGLELLSLLGPCGSRQLLETPPQGKERCEWGLLAALALESLPFILHLPVPLPSLPSAPQGPQRAGGHEECVPGSPG